MKYSQLSRLVGRVYGRDRFGSELIGEPALPHSSLNEPTSSHITDNTLYTSQIGHTLYYHTITQSGSVKDILRDIGEEGRSIRI